MEREFGYDLSRTCDALRPTYHHVESCQKSVPRFRSIWPISCLIFLCIICLLYLGANTIWYLYSHFVCAKLDTLSFIWT